MINVPSLNLKAQHEILQQEILEAIERVIRSQRFILGEEVEMLEERIAAYSQCRYAVGVSSGTDALLVSLMALGIGWGDEVITTPYSFFSAAGSIARVGAKPVFTDIDPCTYNLDPSQMERAITSRTKAVIPVHLFGQCADMPAILEISRRHGLKVIEDAAQALGAEYPPSRRAGSSAGLGCFSFYPTKNLGAMGDGGMVVTSDPDLAQKVRLLRVHGSQPKYYHPLIGGNFRLDALQAAVLNVKFRYLDEWIRKRRERARHYKKLFQGARLEEKGCRLPKEIHAGAGLAHGHTFNQFIVRVPQRDLLRTHLGARGVQTEIYYPLPLHLQECFAYLGHKAGDFPQAESAARETLALPLFPEMTQDQQESVVEAIAEFYSS